MTPPVSMLAVCGGGAHDPQAADLAFETGRLAAERGLALVCGGLGGVMEAAAAGAKQAGGLTVGLLPGVYRRDANPYIDVAIPTGLGHARNLLIVRTGQAVVALPGGPGTLSEVALGLKIGRPVIGLTAWGEIQGVAYAGDPQTAVELVATALSI